MQYVEQQRCWTMPTSRCCLVYHAVSCQEVRTAGLLVYTMQSTSAACLLQQVTNKRGRSHL